MACQAGPLTQSPDRQVAVHPDYQLPKLGHPPVITSVLVLDDAGQRQPARRRPSQDSRKRLIVMMNDTPNLACTL
jgi:hypothetical protein